MTTQDDIYRNKSKWEYIVSNINSFCELPEKPKRGATRKYYIKNKANVGHFRRLFDVFDSKDLSYIRRRRLFEKLLIACFVLDKDLALVTEQEEINQILAFSNKKHKSTKSQRDMRLDLKYLWKILFPEKDEKGRRDDTIFPYPVRHLNGKLDKSKEKAREDKFTYEEFEKLGQAFADDPRMQCLITLAFESLARPQELLYLRIKDVQLYDNYAKIYVSSHGKEGIKLLRCIDSWPYLQRWLEIHPLRHNKEAFLFINIGNKRQYQQMTPFGVNKNIKCRCKKIGINDKITLYSLKRNGVTFLRLRGESDLDIQHRAGWTSTKQLSTYDLSEQEESFRIELIKKGLADPKEGEAHLRPENKICSFCGTLNAFTDLACHLCKRPLDRKHILEESKKADEVLEAIDKFLSDERIQKLFKLMVKNH